MNFKKYYYLAIAFYLIAIIFNITNNYYSTKDRIMSKIDKILIQSCNIAPLLLPKDFHYKDMLVKGIAPENDMENINQLSKQAKILGVKYIYTLIENNNSIHFTSSSATDKELQTNTNLSHFGDLYEDVSPLVFEVFKTNKEAYDDYSDKWGTFHTLYLPLQSSDGTKYIVGADIDVSHINQLLNQNLFYSIRDILFYVFILLPFFLVYRANMNKIKKELEEAIEHKTKELALKQREIFQKSKMEAMGEMIANIAHQWRQPLSVINSNASGIKVQDELGIISKETLHSGLESIMKNVEYLSKTIDNFRNFFSPNKQKETKSINEMFETIDSIFGNSLSEVDIEIVKNIENITLHTYINELSQVIVNLIKNGKDAIKRDGVIIIDCFVDNAIYIKIKDSGGGIPDDVIEKIYDPYFTTKDASTGTGIGLNMSKQIITEHLGGTIEVANVSFHFKDKIDQGAEFTIILPKDLIVK